MPNTGGDESQKANSSPKDDSIYLALLKELIESSKTDVKNLEKKRDKIQRKI